MIPEKAACPECGGTPTTESVQRERLSSLGYRHEDTRFECSNGHTWQVGVPLGDVESTDWVCPSCGGDFMPHFINANTETGDIHVRPKCQECYYVPDEPIGIDAKPQGASIRGLIAHHTVTGERGDESDRF